MTERRETVERLYEAINSGSLDDVGEIMSPDVTWVRPPDVPITGAVHGRRKVAKMWRAAAEPLESLRIEPTRIRELGDGLLAHVTISGTSGGDGARSSFEFSGSQTFRFGDDGGIAEVREFKTITEAEADLGGR